MSDSHCGFGYLLQVQLKMADPIGELNAVFAMCGIVDGAMHANIINQEGLPNFWTLGS